MSAKYDGCLIVFQEQGAHASVWRLTAAALPYSELCEDCGSGSGAAGAVLYRNVDDRTGAVIYQCESCLEASARRTSPHDPRPLVTLFAPGIYPCRDCGTETFCGVAHGAGHDHSVAARECTTYVLTRARLTTPGSSSRPAGGRTLGTATLARTGSTRVDRLLAAALRNGCTVEPSRVVDGCWIIRSAERDDRTLTVYAYGNNGATVYYAAPWLRDWTRVTQAKAFSLMTNGL